MSYHSRQPSVASSLLSSTTFNNINNKIGPWKLGRTLGKGSTGKVVLAEHVTSGKKAAVKVVSKSVLNSNHSNDNSNDNSGLSYGIEREIITMKLLNHKNVLRLYDVWETSKYLYMILEYVEGGELFDLLVECGPLNEYDAINYFRQIIMGICYCHNLGICHRDLKPENILLDGNSNIKLADFGMAALENNDKLLETSCGSPHYAAPEIVSGKLYNGFESDVWSCGIILFALLTGRLPFDDENIRNLLLKVQNGSFEMPSELSDLAKDLIAKMLTVDPVKRIKTMDILNHPLLNKYSYNNNNDQFEAEKENLPQRNDLNKVLKREDIDDKILNNLVILWHGRSKEDIINNLLKTTTSTEKTFYFLLQSYQNHQHENNSDLVRSLSIAKSINNNSNRTPKKSNRRSVNISASSSHKKSVSFNNKQRRSFINNNGTDQPPVPKNLINEFQKISSSNSNTSNKRRSLLPSKRSSMTSKLIQVYAKLANDTDWVYIDKETKRTSSDFATLCDEIFEYEKYEKIRLQEKQRLEKLEQERLELLRLEEEKLEKERLAKEAELAELAEKEKLKEDERLAKIAAELDAQSALESREHENENGDEAGEGNDLDDAITNLAKRSVSDNTKSNSKLLNKQEISQIQKRILTNPIDSSLTRPKSKLDPGLNFDKLNWRTSKFYYDENDSVVQAIRRSKFLGSKFDLNIKNYKRNSTAATKTEKPLNPDDIEIKKLEIKPNSKPIEKEIDLNEDNFPKTLADVKIPQVTRKSRHFSNSNKRLSVLSIYSTKGSYTDLSKKLKEIETPKKSMLDIEIQEEEEEAAEAAAEQEKENKNPIEMDPASQQTPGLRLSYADRLNAKSSDKKQSLILPEISTNSFQIHKDESMDPLPLPLPKDNKSKSKSKSRPKSSAGKEQEEEVIPQPKIKPSNQSMSTTKFTGNSDEKTNEEQQPPLVDITNKKRSTSGSSFFKRMFSSSSSSKSHQQQQQQPVQSKSLNTTFEPVEMYQTLTRLLQGWKDYGLKNIQTNDAKLMILGEISKNNFLNYNSTKFQINFDKYGKNGCSINFSKIKGSTKSFNTLMNEIERILLRENILVLV